MAEWGKPNAISDFFEVNLQYWHQMFFKKERLRYILSFQSIKEMWGMHKAGIDLQSTSNFVLDRLQGSPQQFFNASSLASFLQNTVRVTLRRRWTMLVHQAIQFPSVRDTWVNRALKGSAVTSEPGLQVWAARRETAASNYREERAGVGVGAALFRATGCLSCLPLALWKVTRGGRCPQVETPEYHSWPGATDGRSCCRAVSAVGHCLHTCPRSSL